VFFNYVDGAEFSGRLQKQALCTADADSFKAVFVQQEMRQFVCLLPFSARYVNAKCFCDIFHWLASF
jgi:hypothetical protein